MVTLAENKLGGEAREQGKSEGFGDGSDVDVRGREVSRMTPPSFWHELL